MTKITLPSGEYLLVPVEKYHRMSFLIKGSEMWKICLPIRGHGLVFYETGLPATGNPSLIDLASDITEDVAAGIVEEYPDGYYVDYINPNDPELPYFQAIFFLHSLVRSHGYEPEHCLILKID